MENKWKDYLKDNKWTTILAYQLQKSESTPVETLLKYEALLTQCSYLSRMAYCPADIFCRMTQHLDVTPNAFNNYIRAIEKIYEKLFNYKCSYDSKYIHENQKFSEYFNPISSLNSNDNPIGFFVRNNKNLNAYLYVHHNPESKFNNEKTLFISFKGSSSINDFIHDMKSATKSDRLLSELNETAVKNMTGGFTEKGANGNIELQNISNKTPRNNTVEMQNISINTNAANGNIGMKNISNKTPRNNNAANSDIEMQNIPRNNITVNNKTIKNNKVFGKAGHGFIDILKESIPELCQKIKELESKQFTRVIITGHSLGGALASLFGYYLKKYKSDFINVPIHVITFGACCVFDAPGRNDYNEFLNISDSIFTLDRVTTNFDPVIILPVDLDHPGYTLLRDEIRAFTNTGRTNEIGEIRKMLGLTSGYDGNDLLLSEKFVDLFTNAQDFKGTGRYDTDLYRNKYRKKFGTNAKEQQLILKKAMTDAKDNIRELFKTIESEVAKNRYNNQTGGLLENTKKKRLEQDIATKEYKNKTKEIMPNQIQYNCYKTMTMGFCHGVYMGVSYMTVLRLPGISKNGLKRKKEPTKNYTLYKQDEHIFSLSASAYSNNSDCLKVSNVNRIKNNRKNNKPKSLMNKFTGIFKSKPKPKPKQNNEIVNKSNEQSQNQDQDQEPTLGFFSKCSIL